MMGKKSRFNNRNKNKTDDFVVDRISDLPDSILGHILSFLPTEKAVATSILSKRWEFVWVTVHSLDFSYRKDPGFVPFVKRVLLLNDAGWLKKLGLHLHYRYSRCCPRCISPEVISWINTAIARNVHELNLSVGTMDLPKSLFCCESLRSLNLRGFIRINIYDTGPVFLPRLKSLEMNYISIRSKQDCEIFFSGCPVLDYLKLHIGAYCGPGGVGGVIGYDFTCVISLASLRHLEMYFENSLRFKLNASSLEYLRLVGGPINDIFVEKNLSCLVIAEIDIELYEREFPVNSIIEAVRALDRAKFLTLSDTVMQALSRATISLSAEFKRLVKLEAKSYFSSLQDVIQSSDNLEDLMIEQFSNNDLDGHSEWTTPLEVPRCLSNSLKKVELKNYEGLEDEQEMIRYVLEYGSVLEALHICCFKKYGKKIELLQEICQFPRKSPACEVRFDMYSSKRQLKPLVLISRMAGEMVYLPYSLRDRSTFRSRSTR